MVSNDVSLNEHLSVPLHEVKLPGPPARTWGPLKPFAKVPRFEGSKTTCNKLGCKLGPEIDLSKKLYLWRCKTGCLMDHRLYKGFHLYQQPHEIIITHYRNQEK